MTACPLCGGPGGVPLLLTVAPCDVCSEGDRFRFVLPVDRPPGRVRYVPVVNTIPPRSAKGYAAGLGGVIGAVTWSLNRGECFVGLFPGDTLNFPHPSNINNHDIWTWTAVPNYVVRGGIADMGEDPDDWIDVPDGMDWGQR